MTDANSITTFLFIFGAAAILLGVITEIIVRTKGITQKIVFQWGNTSGTLNLTPSMVVVFVGAALTLAGVYFGKLDYDGQVQKYQKDLQTLQDTIEKLKKTNIDTIVTLLEVGSNDPKRENLKCTFGINGETQTDRACFMVPGGKSGKWIVTFPEITKSDIVTAHIVDDNIGKARSWFKSGIKVVPAFDIPLGDQQ
jgi:hypothetical protein